PPTHTIVLHGRDQRRRGGRVRTDLHLRQNPKRIVRVFGGHFLAAGTLQQHLHGLLRSAGAVHLDSTLVHLLVVLPFEGPNDETVVFVPLLDDRAAVLPRSLNPGQPTQLVIEELLIMDGRGARLVRSGHTADSPD